MPSAWEVEGQNEGVVEGLDWRNSVSAGLGGERPASELGRADCHTLTGAPPPQLAWRPGSPTVKNLNSAFGPSQANILFNRHPSGSQSIDFRASASKFLV